MTDDVLTLLRALDDAGLWGQPLTLDPARTATLQNAMLVGYVDPRGVGFRLTDTGRARLAAARTDGGPAALAGLRRLVVHSRDLLQAAGPADVAGVLTQEQIRRLVAATLAVEVLTLVADCLAPDSPREDHPS